MGSSNSAQVLYLPCHRDTRLVFAELSPTANYRTPELNIQLTLSKQARSRPSHDNVRDFDSSQIDEAEVKPNTLKP